MRLSRNLFWILQNIPTVIVITFRGHSCGWETYEMLIVIGIFIHTKLLRWWCGWLNRSSARYYMIKEIRYYLIELSCFFHLWLIIYLNWNNITSTDSPYYFLVVWTPWWITGFGGGCHLNLYHQSMRNYVEDETLKIQSIHLKDILEESINYNLKSSKFYFIVEGRISQIKPYWVLRVKFCLFYDNMEAQHFIMTKE